MVDKCRVCLCGDRRMCAIRNTVFQEVWEKLTNAKFNTDDGKPLLVCYICCAQLRKSHELMKRSLKAEELLTAVMNKGSQQSQDTVLLVASLTQDFRYKYTMEEVHQLDCKESKRDTLEEIKKEYEEESEEYKVEENNINIKEEEEDWTDTHQEDDLNIADVEPAETPCDYDTPLKKILRREVRIILKRVDTGAPARKRTLDEVPQITKRIKLEETTEDIEPLTDAVLEILPNNNNKGSDIFDFKKQADSKQNTKSTVNCYQRNKISTKVNIVPQSKIQAENAIVQNSKTLNFRDCCNSGEDEIVKQSIPKRTDAVAPITPEDCVIETTLNRNLHNQTGGNLYLCDLCEYKSSRKDNLIIHIKFKHINVKKFSCHMCQYKCVAKSDMKKHFRKHTGEKPYKCDLCEYRCSVTSCLKTHRKYKHTNEKKYTCRMCQYKCVKKNDLIRHVRRHTGEKPYTCDLCDHKCSDNSRLQIHIKYKHTKEKNFTCHVCNYRCVVKSTLKRHLRKHTGEKPYTCENCDYKSSDRSNLKKHIKSKHAK